MKESGAQLKPGRARARRQVIVNRLVAALIVFVVFIVPIGFFVGGPTLLKSYDRSHLVTLQCTVDSAEANNTSSRSNRGIGSSSAEIVLATSCGEFVYVNGVTYDNAEALARQLQRDPDRSLSVGKGSITLRGLLEFFNLLPRVHKIGGL
ncbi:hypothetical protein [Curtobacterium sp. MCSS17_015]|uniref:hypothetical protein n=1 Tax=Curtobacterium sp. MCSS17_015 TaxID=2175666 RepID=UPI000DA93AB2|nr:hypothetical protein [Curtobacterium sp. MCSS17_015]WIB26154.1 hypothetical protein DEJ18_14050 [Curtobacterium sp. MCSS17_015]